MVGKEDDDPGGAGAMRDLLAVFGWLPGLRGLRRRRAQVRLANLSRLAGVLGDLASALEHLARLADTTDQDDVAAIIREAALTAEIIEALPRGGRLISGVQDTQLKAAWQRLTGSVTSARLRGQGPRKAAKLRGAAADCLRLQQLVEARLGSLKPRPHR